MFNFLKELGYEIDQNSFNLKDSPELNELLKDDPYLMNKLFIQDNLEEMSHLKILDNNQSKNQDKNNAKSNDSIDFNTFISSPVTPLTQFLFPKKVIEMNQDELIKQVTENPLIHQCQIRDETFSGENGIVQEENFQFISLMQYNIFQYLLGDIIKEFNQEDQNVQNTIQLNENQTEDSNELHQSNCKNVPLGLDLPDMQNVCTKQCDLFQTPSMPNVLAQLHELHSSDGKMPRINFFSFIPHQLTLENNLRLTLVWWMNMRQDRAATTLLDYGAVRGMAVPEQQQMTQTEVELKNDEFEAQGMKKRAETTDADRAQEALKQLYEKQ